MDKLRKSSAQRELLDLLQQQPPADWVRAMIEHYRRTGSYRPQDLRRLLGDPTKGVTVGPESSLASLLASKERHR